MFLTAAAAHPSVALYLSRYTEELETKGSAAMPAKPLSSLISAEERRYQVSLSV